MHTIVFRLGKTNRLEQEFISNFLILIKIMINIGGHFESLYGLILSINMTVTINKEDSAGEDSNDWQLITYPALFKSSFSPVGIKYQFYLILYFQRIAAKSLIHCTSLVLISTMCTSPCKCKIRAVQDPTHPECGCHSNSWWLWVSSFLEFPVFTSNLVIISLWTGTGAQTTLWDSLP